MGINYGNVTKANFQADIKRKQAFFSRCKRRFKVAQTPAERNWLKSEVTRVCNELKQCCKKWKTYGFGGHMWITKNYNVTNFNAARSGVKSMPKSAPKTAARKTASCKTASRKNTTRKSSTRSTAKRTTGRAKAASRTRSNAARRSYSAW